MNIYDKELDQAYEKNFLETKNSNLMKFKQKDNYFEKNKKLINFL